MDEFAQFKATFFAECAELLADLDSHLSSLDSESFDPEVMNAIFRAVHSIKAGAGAFKFVELVGFAHRFEALLDRMRDGRVAVTDAAIGLLLKAGDILAALVEAAEGGAAVEAGFGDEVAADLDAMAQSDGDGAAAAPKAEAEPQAAGEGEEIVYRVVFKPHDQLFQHANEPLLILRELGGLGTLKVEADTSRLPSLAKMEPEAAYLAWTMELTTDRGESEIHDAFEFVVDECDLTVERSAAAAPAASEASAEAAAAKPASAKETGKKKAAAADQGGRGGRMSSIRVDLDRVDRLVNMVGELVITQSMLSQQTSNLPSDRFPTIIRGLEELAFHTRELQESVMAIRMQPVKSVFARIPRIVRDLSSKLDKNVTLVTKGENTEVDKTVVEEISDPITHMIRNSIDHGLELPEDRVAAGKPAEGTILLSAEHRSGRIVITIEDDGRGINRDKVLEKAIANGLVQKDASLSDEEIYGLIFAPGFSTAEKVTDVSGRGVGMDVVKRNIQALGGRVGIRSTPGKGTTFTMTLPLTLAVMDGMIVAAGGEKFVIPIANIVECMRPAAQDVRKLPNGSDIVSVRGDQLMLVYLGKAFGIHAAIGDPTRALVVLVDTEDKGRVGIVVDELLGQQQVVIKSLEANYDPVPGLSGATILGNGRVAPILDIDGLCSLNRSEPGDLGFVPATQTALPGVGPGSNSQTLQQ